MGKNNRDQRPEVMDEAPEMTAAESRAYRASLAPAIEQTLSDEDKREAFRIFWAQAKAQYGKSRDLEEILWLHLKTIKMDKPEQFEAGISHFGLNKIR